MEDNMEPIMSGDYQDAMHNPAMDQPQGITKSGRVRKKSAKVLEMEEAEEMEKKEQKKFIASLKNKNVPAAAKSATPATGTKKLLKSGTCPVRPAVPSPVKVPPVTSPVKIATTSPKVIAKLVATTSPTPTTVQLVSSPTSPVGSGSAIKFLLSTPVVETKAPTLSTAKKPIMNPVALQMALDVGAPPPSSAELEKNAKKSKSKKVGQMLMGPPPTLEIPVEQKSDPIRLKLLLSPKQESVVKEEPPPSPPQPVIPEVTFMTNLPEIAPPPVKKKKKIKKEPVTSPTPVSDMPAASSLLSHLQSAPTPPTMLPTYEEHVAASEGDLIIDTDKKRKKPKVKKEKKEKGEKGEKKSKSKKAAMVQQSHMDMLPQVMPMGQQQIQTDLGPVYSNTSEMAMKVKTSAEKKAGKGKKSKKSREDPSKPKKKKVPTATLR